MDRDRQRKFAARGVTSRTHSLFQIRDGHIPPEVSDRPFVSRGLRETPVDRLGSSTAHQLPLLFRGTCARAWYTEHDLVSTLLVADGVRTGERPTLDRPSAGLAGTSTQPDALPCTPQVCCRRLAWHSAQLAGAQCANSILRTPGARLDSRSAGRRARRDTAGHTAFHGLLCHRAVDF